MGWEALVVHPKDCLQWEKYSERCTELQSKRICLCFVPYFAAGKQGEAAPCSLFPEAISVVVLLLEGKQESLEDWNKSSAKPSLFTKCKDISK